MSAIEIQDAQDEIAREIMDQFGDYEELDGHFNQAPHPAPFGYRLVIRLNGERLVVTKMKREGNCLTLECRNGTKLPLDPVESHERQMQENGLQEPEINA